MIEDMPSSPKDPDALVTSFFESIQGHHLTAALDMMSQDCEYDNVPITKVFGRAAIEQTLGGFLAECSAYEWIIQISPKLSLTNNSASPQKHRRNIGQLSFV
ncbi:MAG: hypothetical protein EBU37_05525 [Actinobacteria bacterium]|nr:hypothetical protein [Actinomycetota bacterium]